MEILSQEFAAIPCIYCKVRMQACLMYWLLAVYYCVFHLNDLAICSCYAIQLSFPADKYFTMRDAISVLYQLPKVFLVSVAIGMNLFLFVDIPEITFPFHWLFSK